MMQEILRLKGVYKNIHTDKVLRDVNMQLFRGEIVGLLGLQQTGKTALVRILDGRDRPDSGQLYLNEVPAEFSTPLAARQAGIYNLTVKDLLAGNLTAAENLYVLNRSPVLRHVSPRDLAARARFTFQQFGLHIAPESKGKNLSKTEQAVLCLLQIALQDPRLIIIDNGLEYELEDYDTFERMVLHFRRLGISFLIVSNKVTRLISCCDRIYAIRGDTLSSPIYKSDIYPENLYRILDAVFPPQPQQPASAPPMGKLPILELFSLRLRPNDPPVDLALYPGEICALIPPAPVSAEDLGYALYGMQRPFSGTIYFDGQRLNLRRAQDAISKGIVLIPNDMRAVIFPNFDLKDNLLLPYMRYISRHGLHPIRSKFNEMAANALKHSYSVPSTGVTRRLRDSQLSISTLHRLSIARWEPLNPRLYILINPFSVLDAHSSTEICRLFHRLADSGRSILLLAPNACGLKNACTRLVQL